MMIAAAGGAVASWLVTKFLARTIGTTYVKEKDCQNCQTKKDLSMLRVLVVELAIKAGVPAHEVAKLAGTIKT